VKIVWSDRAQADIAAVYRYLDVRNPVAAQKVMRTISAAASQLEAYPELGRPAPESNCRLLQVPRFPYLLAHRIRSGAVEILAVFDERRERPREWL
jgi:toxin ParE1/3/4